jgi:hypothetical protein
MPEGHARNQRLDEKKRAQRYLSQFQSLSPCPKFKRCIPFLTKAIGPVLNLNDGHFCTRDKQASFERICGSGWREYC